MDDAKLTAFRKLATSLFQSPTIGSSKTYEAIVEQMHQADRPHLLVEALLTECVDHAEQNGIDVGIDLLSQTHGLALASGLRRLLREGPTLNLGEVGPKEQHAWYILIRSACRAAVDEPTCLSLLRRCVQSRQQAIREAVVDGLFDLGTPAAREMLDEIARTDREAAVRQMAAEAAKFLSAA